MPGRLRQRRIVYILPVRFLVMKKAPLGRLALGLIVVTISPPIGIVRCGTAVRFEFAMKHGVVLFAHPAGRCGCLLLVGFV